MTTTASQVVKGKTYRNVSDKFTVDYTINEIVITKAGRYKFISDRKWVNTNTGEITFYKNIKSNSAVGADYKLFQIELNGN